MSSLSQNLQSWQSNARQMWQALQPRERMGLGLAATLLALLLFWLVLIAPAWRTFQTAPAINAQLDAQLSEMQALAAQAKALHATPTPSPVALEAWLKANVGVHKSSSVSTVGSKVTVQVVQVDAQTLSQWIVQARTQMGLRVVQLNLKKMSPSPAAQGKPSVPVYSGQLVWSLP